MIRSRGTSYTCDYRYVFHAPLRTVMYRLIVHSHRDDHLLLFAILSLGHADFVQVENQFGFHPMDLFS
jgi:hypothetical protein